MSAVRPSITVSDVTCINRVGTGPVYRAVVSVEDLHGLLENSTIRYSPRYQRGFKRQPEDIPESKYNLLLPLTHPELDIKATRAEEMAVKYLKASAGDHGTMLFSSHVTWNARKERGGREPHYSPADRTLTIYSTITVPDTGHRHMGYYLVGHWKNNPTEIPAQVIVNEVPVTKEEIEAMLRKLDLSDHGTHSVYVDIYTLPAEQEGWLYDEFNSDAKPPARAVALDLNARKTPSRRFVFSLMDTCDMFGRKEVEYRSNTIAAKSRKLTTNSTLEAAVRPFNAELIRAEQQGAKYKDLIGFCCAFFKEYGHHFPAALPGASYEQRQKLRDSSFAISNIMFFPLFKIAFEFWKHYEAGKKDWRKESSWKVALGKIAGVTVVNGPGRGGRWRGNVMSKDNPAWRGKILIDQFDAKGVVVGHTLSSTRQTRDAAYAYLRSLASASLPAQQKGKEAA